MLAKEFRVPVVAAVETYKFADVTRLDGLGSNEILKREDMRRGWEGTGARGDRKIGNERPRTWGREWEDEEVVEKEDPKGQQGLQGKRKGHMASLALLYDLTPADYITALCTEVCLRFLSIFAAGEAVMSRAGSVEMDAEQALTRQIGLIPPRSGPTVTGKSSGVV